MLNVQVNKNLEHRRRKGIQRYLLIMSRFPQIFLFFITNRVKNVKNTKSSVEQVDATLFLQYGFVIGYNRQGTV
jgi:hypothetical protein